MEELTNDFVDLNRTDLRDALLAGTNSRFMQDAVLNKGNQASIAKALKKSEKRTEHYNCCVWRFHYRRCNCRRVAHQYGTLVKDWFAKAFPKVTINFVNAGIGSTTSLVGVHRMDKQVLCHNPDFVIVDFTTNDASGDPQYKSTYESIIRRLLEAENSPGILSVFFGAVNNYDKNNAAGANVRRPNSQSIHMPALLYYDIPIIDFYGEMWTYLDAGIVQWTDYMADSIHPNRVGHKMVANCIIKYLDTVYKNLDNIDIAMPNYPKNFFYGTDVYQTATMLTPDNFEPDSNSGFARMALHGEKLIGWHNSGGSAELTFTVTSTKSLALFFQYRARNGTAEITVNGQVYNVNGDNPNVVLREGEEDKNPYIWIFYNTVTEMPQDYIITVKATGPFGFGPICITP